MNTCLSVLAVSAILVAGVALTPIYAQGTLEVTTDKASYSDGETVQVTGQVGQVVRGDAVALQVIAPNNNIVQVEQLTVASDGTFAVDIVAGKQWKTAGDYTVKVFYGGNTGQTTIAFGGSDGAAPAPQPPTDPAPTPTPTPTPGSLLPPGSPMYAVEGSDVSVGYSITGGTLTSIAPDEASSSIVIGIDADSDGTLIIDFPREVLDAKVLNGGDGCSGSDDSFIVLVDGEERDFEESIADTVRSLSIGFEAGASQIEVIGTCVIPEFGAVAVVILAVAVVAIVAMTARSRLSILSRY